MMYPKTGANYALEQMRFRPPDKSVVGMSEVELKMLVVVLNLEWKS